MGTQGEPLTSMQNPLPAEVSMQAYSVPAGFHLSLWAKELVENWPEGKQANSELAGLKGKPIAMNWDERGRLWICETIDYPNELQSPGEGVIESKSVKTPITMARPIDSRCLQST